MKDRVVADMKVVHVNYKNENESFSSVLCEPEEAGKYPGIITIHGIYGLQEMDVNFAQRLSSQGYVVLAHGWQSNEKDPSDLSIVEGIKAAIQYLKHSTSVDQERMGLIGVCRGGSITMIAGASITDFKLLVSFYGQAYYPLVSEKNPVSPINLVDHIQAPMLLIHGEDDRIFDCQESVDYCAALESQGKVHECKLYPGAGHGFFLEGHRNYHKQAAEDSWIVLSRFLSNQFTG
jgi:carboxymethylenebutenolidase